MRVIVDTSLCQAHSDCVLAAPEVFDLDEEKNVAVVLQESPPESMRAEVEEAADLCPVRAIQIED